jgi:peroxin-1
LYNAHLEVVHESIIGPVTASAAKLKFSSEDGVDDDDNTPIEHTSFGGPAQNTVKSRAEQMAAQRRVKHSFHWEKENF